MRTLLLTISLVAIIAGCEQNLKTENPRPQDLISEDLYLNVFMEIQMLDALIYTTDSLPDVDSLHAEIFKQYDVEQEQFQRSHRYYQKDVDGQIGRLDSVLKWIETEREYILQMRDSLSSANR